MCAPEPGLDTPFDARREAELLAFREGIRDRRMANGNGTRWDMIWKVLSVIAVPWAMWVSVMLIDVKERVSVIEGNRFSSEDAYKMMLIVNDKADSNEVPPAWFLREFNELEGSFLAHLEESR